MSRREECINIDIEILVLLISYNHVGTVALHGKNLYAKKLKQMNIGNKALVDSMII